MLDFALQLGLQTEHDLKHATQAKADCRLRARRKAKVEAMSAKSGRVLIPGFSPSVHFWLES